MPIFKFSNANDNTNNTSLLVAHHNLEVVEVALYYLKQESILAARDLLKDIGQKYKFNDHWNQNHTNWKLAENTLVHEIMTAYRSDFFDYKWLYPQWRKILDQKLTNKEIIFLSKHFSTPVGGKQVHIIDHQMCPRTKFFLLSREVQKYSWHRNRAHQLSRRFLSVTRECVFCH